MKKLLLVLLVVALASFLFVGCLPVTPSEGEGEGEGEGEVEAAITFDPEYTDAGGVTYVACGSDVIVTLPAAVETDYVVYAAVKVWNESLEVYEYFYMESGEPDATRTVWTIENYTYADPCEYFKGSNGIEICECEPVCIVALVKHPCCPGEEVALRVVSIDCTAPAFDLYVKFTDCEDVCIPDDPCVEEFEGVSMEWTSRASDACETVDCCEDTCSGVNGWSLVIDPDECLGPCDTVSGTGCPVEGVLECACLPYTDTGEECYYVDFSFEDNVGNAVTSTWKICLDTDSVVSFGFDGQAPLTADGEGWYTLYNLLPLCPDFELD